MTLALTVGNRRGCWCQGARLRCACLRPTAVLQALVDLPPEVARVANQAAATGGQVLGESSVLLSAVNFNTHY
jgi:hypothetical protein